VSLVVKIDLFRIAVKCSSDLSVPQAENNNSFFKKIHPFLGVVSFIMPSLATVLTTSTLIFSSFTAAKVCPPQGAVLPAPRAPHSNSAVKKAAEGLKATLDKRLESFQASGISIGVKSIHEDEHLFEYNLTPEIAEDIGTDKIDSDSIFRVGSLSKLVPVLGVLQQNGVNLDDSILEYIPELQGASEDDELTATQWEDVTIRSLMSHMSGMATDSEFCFADSNCACD
jgi:CubicO group peptidase (beta-lactamase class C family)